MKLSENQIKIIYQYAYGYCIDIEKLISYLEKHRTIQREVFNYCSRVSKLSDGSRGYSMYLDNEPMYTPVDRDTFIRRIPFYFYQIPVGASYRSALSFIIPIADKNSDVTEDYELFYADLEMMLYELGIPIEVIFGYASDQVAPEKDHRDNIKRMSGSMFYKGVLNSRYIFFLWRKYLHLCIDNEWKDYTPSRLITAYNEILVKTGKKPIIYFPIKEYGIDYKKIDNEIICHGHFPCDCNGIPIWEWTSILVKHPISIHYNGKKSKCGELRIKLGPKTIVYVRDDEMKNDEDPAWQQLYAGPQTMEFDNSVLREFRKAKNMGNVAK